MIISVLLSHTFEQGLGTGSFPTSKPFQKDPPVGAPGKAGQARGNVEIQVETPPTPTRYRSRSILAF